MTRLLILICTAALLTSSPRAYAAGGVPPLLTRTQYAPFLAFYDPPPLPAVPPPTWRLAVGLDYSSLFQAEGNDQTGGTVDMEIGRLTIYAGRRLGSRLAVDIEIPFLWTNGGFLDDFISNWHATFGLPNGNRDRAPSDRHLYRLTLDGEPVIDEDRGDRGLGDSAATLTYLVTPPDGSVVAALRIGAKAPTGGRRLSLRGSGGWDYAAGLLVEARPLPWSAALHVSAIYPTGVSEVDVWPFATGLLSVAWQLNDRCDLLGELAGRTSPFDTGVEIFDDPALELRLGVRTAMRRRGAFEVAFVEDLTHRTTPDFSVHVAWRLTHGE